jgi:transposase-like protein
MGKRRYYLWRAVDDEGKILDVLVQKRRNKTAALRLMHRFLKSHDTNLKPLLQIGWDHMGPR